MRIWQAHKGKIESASFSPDGSLLATATGGTRTPYLWNPATGELVRKPHGSYGTVWSVCFAPDAPMFAAGTAASITIWRTDTWEVLGELQMRHAYELTFGPGESPELVASSAGRVDTWTDLWSLTPGAKRRPANGTYSPPGNVAAVHLSADGELLVTSTVTSAELWRTSDRKAMKTLRQGQTNVRGAVRFSPDSQRVAVASGKWLEVWPVPEDRTGVASKNPDGTPLLRIAAGVGRSPIIWAVGWTAAGNEVLSAGNDGFVRMWSASTGAEVKAFDWQIGKLFCAAFAPDGLTCAACGEKGQIVVWDVDQ
jgi:WD40 repeat protein